MGLFKDRGSRLLRVPRRNNYLNSYINKGYKLLGSNTIIKVAIRAST